MHEHPPGHELGLMTNHHSDCVLVGVLDEGQNRPKEPSQRETASISECDLQMAPFADQSDLFAILRNKVLEQHVCLCDSTGLELTSID